MQCHDIMLDTIMLVWELNEQTAEPSRFMLPPLLNSMHRGQAVRDQLTQVKQIQSTWQARCFFSLERKCMIIET